MRKLNMVVAVIAILALSAGAALAQYGGSYGGMYDEDIFEGFRVHAGWAWPGDLDDEVVYGADYIWRSLLLTGNYIAADGDIDVWTAELSYLLRGQEDPGLYYGAGGGWAWVGNGGDDDSIIFNVVIGKEFYSPGQLGQPAWFLEARYNFGSDFDPGDIDGLRVVGGFHF
jgi:hypothetical protein